jgi:hypothetical protein
MPRCRSKDPGRNQTPAIKFRQDDFVGSAECIACNVVGLSLPRRQRERLRALRSTRGNHPCSWQCPEFAGI